MLEKGVELKEALIAKRYGIVGKSAFYLNPVQRSARDAVLRKINDGIYKYTRASCPLCGADSGTTVSKIDTYGLPSEVVVCHECQFVYTAKYLDAASLFSFYNNEYRPLDRGVSFPAEAFFKLQWEKGALIVQALQGAGVTLLKGAKIMEMGCGAGGILGYFKDNGYSVRGFDIGSEYLNFGKTKHGLDLREGDISVAIAAMEAEGFSPDLVIYEQVLEHLQNPLEELRRLKEFLSEKAVLFLGVPGLQNIPAHYDADFLRYLQLPHLCHFDLSSLASVCRKAGFSLIRGDEKVRAVFSAGGERESTRAGGLSPDRLGFLRELELEHRRRLPRKIFVRFGQALKRFLRAAGAGVVKRHINRLARSAAGRR